MTNLGQKIAVVGVSASGKSVFSRKLADKTGLPLTHIDTIMWRPGWDYIGDEMTVEKLRDESSKESWIIEGFIEKKAFGPVLGQADSIIYFDYPRYLPAWRYIKRWLKHRKVARPEIAGCPERFSFAFLRRIWERREVYRLNRFLESSSYNSKILKLSSPKEADTLLNQL